MRDEIEALNGWMEEGVPFALATVIGTSRSAPRPAGAVLALHPDGRILGNVSGGCVEPAVIGLAEDVLRHGVPQRVSFGYSDAEALDVGLTCGGEVDILIRRVDVGSLPLGPLAAAVEADVSAVLATVVEAPGASELIGASLVVTGEQVHGTLGESDLGRVLATEAGALLGVGGVTLRHLGPRGERTLEDVTVLIESFADRPRLLIFGAIDYAAAVASMGRFLGFRVIVCDARAAFVTRDRFPDADEIVVEWPHRYLARTGLDARGAVCVLTHDPKFDVPAIVAALQTPANYIGVMGSRRTHADRLERLREAGVSEEGLARLHSPIGLDLGGRSPQETAVSIAAEIVMVRNGATASQLRSTDGAIHAPVVPAVH
jgi:xanthine dehydrogenase accessory factor